MDFKIETSLSLLKALTSVFEQKKIKEAPPALSLAEYCLESFPFDAKLYALAGVFSLWSQHYPKALFYFHQAQECDPHLSLGDYPLLLQLFSGDALAFTHPQKTLNRVLKDFHKGLEEQAKIYEYQGALKLAQTLFEFCFKKQASPALKSSVVRIAWKTGQIQRIPLLFTSEEQSGRVRPWVAYAYAQNMEGLVSDREKELKKKLLPWITLLDHPSAHFVFAHWYFDQKEWDRAEGHLLSALQRRPQEVSFLQKRIDFLEKRGRLQEALPYRQTLESLRLQTLPLSPSTFPKLPKTVQGWREALSEKSLNSALKQALQLKPPQRYLVQVWISFLRGQLSKAQALLRQIPFEHQEEVVYLWRAAFFLGERKEFLQAEFELKPFGRVQDEDLEEIRIYGSHFLGERSEVCHRLRRYFQEKQDKKQYGLFSLVWLLKHYGLEPEWHAQRSLLGQKDDSSSPPWPLWFCVEIKRSREKPQALYPCPELAFLTQQKNTPQSEEALEERSLKSLALFPSPVALHNHGIFLYRRALSGKGEEAFAFLQFWKRLFLDASYWEYWFALLSREGDSRMTPLFFQGWKKRIVEELLKNVIEVVRERFSEKEQALFLQELRCSPFEDLPALLSFFYQPFLETRFFIIKKAQEKRLHCQSPSDWGSLWNFLEDQLEAPLEKQIAHDPLSFDFFRPQMEELAFLALESAEKVREPLEEGCLSVLFLEMAETWSQKESTQQRILSLRAKINKTIERKV